MLLHTPVWGSQLSSVHSLKSSHFGAVLHSRVRLSQLFMLHTSLSSQMGTKEHCPSLQTFFVQLTPSSQSGGKLHSPVILSQRFFEHASPSSQSCVISQTAAPVCVGTQLMLKQRLLGGQRGRLLQLPVELSQLSTKQTSWLSHLSGKKHRPSKHSARVHGSGGTQIGAFVHTPARQLSCVQSSPSSQSMGVKTQGQLVWFTNWGLPVKQASPLLQLLGGFWHSARLLLQRF